MHDSELLELAVRLARRAGEAIMGVRAAGFAVERKQDRSPVTEADRVAEAIIVEGLRAATPDIPVIAEEEVEAGIAPASAARCWLVDPLDGTREFAAQRPNFTVNIGLVDANRAYLGAVAVPVTGEVFAGGVGLGAWKELHGARQPIVVREPPEEGLTIMGSRHYADDPRLPRFLEGRRVAIIVPMGSAEKFCRLAEGTADLYPRFGRTMEWDTAGPQAVLEAAGGRVVGFDGAPLRYGKPRFENAGFVAAGRTETGWAGDAGTGAS
jgi:3'(2'), 5'-bisphosphate nucleotidase